MWDTGWLAPFIGLWIGWARVAMGIHYVGDVLAGVVLGWGVGRLARKGVRDAPCRKGE